MKKGPSIIGYLILLIVLFSGLWEPLTTVITWLVTQNMKDSGLSIAGEIIVKVATWFISFGLVGIVFDAIGHHNKARMSAAYTIISLIVSLVLSYVVMILEKHFIIVLIAVFVLLAAVIILTIYLKKKYKYSEWMDD